MRAMKNGSVLGCTFWQAGVLTLSRRDQWGFSSLSMRSARSCTPLPWCLKLQAQACEPLLAQPPLCPLPLSLAASLRPRLQLLHPLFKSLPI